jgi:hypothetical protein
MNTPTFDLVEIVKVVQRNLKLILAVTIAAALIGGIGNKLKDKEYQAEGEVYLLNPLFGDRNHIFRQADEIHFVDYFGTEGDVDRVMTMIASKDVEDSVIRFTDLYKAYGLDPQKPADRVKMTSRYRNDFESKRTENSSIMTSYTDTDPKRSAEVLDAIIKITDFKLRQYIAAVKHNSMQSVQRKIEQTDLEIVKYTDSLVKLREQYGIYDIISPVRKGMTPSAVNHNNSARGIEEVQNIEAVKDQLVISRAELATIANGLNANTADEVQLLYNVSTPVAPDKPHGLSAVLTAIACALAAFFFCVLLFSFTAYIKALVNTQR